MSGRRKRGSRDWEHLQNKAGVEGAVKINFALWVGLQFIEAIQVLR